jgi:hypothetical protein
MLQVSQPGEPCSSIAVDDRAARRRKEASLLVLARTAPLVGAAEVDDIRTLERELRRMQREVCRVFAAIYGKPRRRDWIRRQAA